MFVLGIDIGTTGCKAIAVNGRGEVVGSGYQGYGLITGSGGCVEQDPGQWCLGMADAVRQATMGLDRQQIGALSLSTQAASSLLVDEDFTPLTHAITWMDTRSAPQKDAIEKELGNEYIYRTTGWRAHAALDMAKGRWLAENEAMVFQKARYFVSTLEYVNYHLTGVAVIDPTNSALRQLMDIRTKEWDPTVLQCARIDERKLPPIAPSGSLIGCLTASAAEMLRLHTGVKVFNGAHDQYCGALGAAILKPGELMLSTGTAWVIMAVSDKAVYSQSFISPGPHVIPGLYGALASLPASGAALDWLKNGITGNTYDEINRNAAERLDRRKEVYFYPYLAGACFPGWDGNAKASIIGMDMDTDRYDLALACMEGVAFQLRMALDDYAASGIAISDIRVMGGATNSPVWLSIIAAVCGRNLHVMRVKDTPCVGAACIAGVGLGVFDGYGQAARLMNQSMEYEPPSHSLSDYYQQKYQRYASKWTILQSVYMQE